MSVVGSRAEITSQNDDLNHRHLVNLSMNCHKLSSVILNSHRRKFTARSFRIFPGDLRFHLDRVLQDYCLKNVGFQLKIRTWSSNNIEGQDHHWISTEILQICHLFCSSKTFGGLILPWTSRLALMKCRIILHHFVSNSDEIFKQF